MRQLNLLPPTRRRLLYRQAILANVRRFLRSLLVAYAIVTLGCVAAIATLQIMLVAASSESLVNLPAEVLTYQARRAELAKENITLKHMHDLSTKEIKWSENLNEFLALLPPGVTITQMSGQKVNNEFQLSFRGVAANRNTLVIIAERLEKFPWVSSVAAPHTNLLERENPPYQFTVGIRHTEETAE